jgi:hypothetical protein
MTTPTPIGDNALSYVPKIIAAYDKAINSTKGSLDYAIEAGELLNSAKEALPKKGGWLRWLGSNLPNIPERTASLYMRLAENKAVIDQQRVADAIREGGLSIRAAAKFIPQSAKAKAAAAKRKATLAEKKSVAAAKTIDDLLQDLAVDEVYTALKNTHEVGYLAELAQMIIEGNKRPAPDDRRSAPTAPAERRV